MGNLITIVGFLSIGTLATPLQTAISPGVSTGSVATYQSVGVRYGDAQTISESHECGSFPCAVTVSKQQITVLGGRTCTFETTIK